MEILQKLEWCCVEIPVGNITHRSVLTPAQIQSEIYSDLEIGDNVNVDDKQGTNTTYVERWRQKSLHHHLSINIIFVYEKSL